MRSLDILLLVTTISFAVATQKLVTEEFSTQSFGSDAVVGWKVVNSVLDQVVSTCDKVSLFGGYNLFAENTKVEKEYNSQVDHYQLMISFDLYIIDTWDNETFKVYLDDTLGSQTTFPRTAYCGQKVYLEQIKAVSISVPHFRRDFTLRLTTDLNGVGTDESWGIRDLQILANYDTEIIKVISEEFLSTNFHPITTNWEFQGVTQGKEFSECGTWKMLGGIGIFGKQTSALRKVDGLGDHFGLILNFDFYYVDSWDWDDTVSIIIDSQVYTIGYPKPFIADQVNLCGLSGYKEQSIKMSLFVPHRATSVRITFQGNLDESKENESFGFANFKILQFSALPNASAAVKDLIDLTATTSVIGWYDVYGKKAATAVKTCSSVGYLGPFKDDLIKTITSLPAHNSVRIFIKVLTQGNWNGNAKIRFVVNNSWVNAMTSDNFQKNQVCDSVNEQLRNIFIDVPHFSENLEFRISTNNLESNSVYYVREFIVVPYTNSESQISIQEFTGTEIDSSNWLVAGNTLNRKSTTCGTLNLLGGYQAFGQQTTATRTFDIAQAHTFVRITLTGYLIDTWDEGEFLSIFVDDDLVKKISKTSLQIGNYQQCGQIAYKDEAILVDVLVKHSNPTLKLTLKDNLGSDTTDESWGLRDITIQTLNYRTNPVNNNGGGSSQTVYQGEIDKCVKVFSSCDYQGEMFPICEDISDLEKSGWNKPIKSIILPAGKSIQLYKQAGFTGEEQKLSTSQACLAGKTFMLVNQAFNLTVSDEDQSKTKLRIQKSF